MKIIWIYIKSGTYSGKLLINLSGIRCPKDTTIPRWNEPPVGVGRGHPCSVKSSCLAYFIIAFVLPVVLLTTSSVSIFPFDLKIINFNRLSAYFNTQRRNYFKKRLGNTYCWYFNAFKLLNEKLSVPKKRTFHLVLDACRFCKILTLIKLFVIIFNGKLTPNVILKRQIYNVKCCHIHK